MAKTQKYEDAKLLEAVVKYSEQYRGKIEATKLARWASENIEGLEGVEDRHFMRPTTKKDPRTGKLIKQLKLCAIKINEINIARSTVTAMNTNPLLKASNVDQFLKQPINEQRRMILETRSQIDKLVAGNANLRSENKVLATQNQELSAKTELLSYTLEELKNKQEKILTLLSRAMDAFDEQERRKMLEGIGVYDGAFDLNTYVDSLTLQLSDAFSINDQIKRHHTAANKSDLASIVEGINFE